MSRKDFYDILHQLPLSERAFAAIADAATAWVAESYTQGILATLETARECGVILADPVQVASFSGIVKTPKQRIDKMIAEAKNCKTKYERQAWKHPEGERYCQNPKPYEVVAIIGTRSQLLEMESPFVTSAA